MLCRDWKWNKGEIMWSKSLESRIVKHEKQSDDIIRYAQELFPDDNSCFQAKSPLKI